ncbi:pilus assembly protein [Marinobacter sp.]|uniref:pilus assembly protein n=1 Tax=Marinobacter sp. TaxID=50741 RepID=UPI0035667377
MTSFRERLPAFMLGFLLIAPCSGYASPGELADEPLYLASVIEPNIMFIKDDSGSMQWETIPDGVANTSYLFPPADNMYGGATYSIRIPSFEDGNTFNLAGRTSANNPLFYNPLTTYQPWYNEDRTQWPSVAPDAAPFNPGRSASGTLDLTSSHQHFYWRSNSAGAFNQWRTYYPVTFYVIEDSSGNLVSDPNNGTYQRIQIRGGTAYKKNLVTGTEQTLSSFDWSSDVSRTVTQEVQNFANWFSYHRSRTLAARAGIGDAFSRQPENLRIGYGSLNKGSSSVDGVNTSVISSGVRGFSGTDRAAFFDTLYTSNVPAAGTPLKGALDKAGEYYQRTDSRGPWGATPGTTSAEAQLECRRAFSILMTDGYYSDSVSGFGNTDGTDGPTIGDFSYEAVSPFTDGRSNTLADVAMYYWKNDLRTDLDNKIRPTKLNPAFWQHMTTYGVGLGVTGSVDPDSAFAAIESGADITWPGTGTNAGKIDDLLHAGVNSRGGFFSAADPETFAKDLSGVLFDIVNIEGTSTGVTFNTATLETDTLLFGARFDSTSWTGDLFAFGLTQNQNGPPTINANESWEAAALLNARDLTNDPRNIITSDGTAGISLTWDQLNAEQQADLRYGGDDALGQQRINYLRGFSVNGMRTRDSLLGDIVNSTPVYVSRPSRDWPNAVPFGTTANTYADFKAAKQNRTPVVYVGANDGMLHAFSADENNGGRELFGYIPEFIFSDEDDRGLHFLTDPDYQHRFYVDLSPVVSDVYTQGAGNSASDWRTILIGGARAGGRGIFALDVTDPTQFSENTASNIALWEFTSDDDPRMGYITEPPTIGLARWGNNDYRWTAFFGNGYNSPTPATGIFMLDIEGGLDGDWSDSGDYRFIAFDTASDASGMSAVRQLDLTGNRIIDRIYAGDLKGNVWAAEVQNNGTWSTVHGNNSNPAPLFTATYGSPAEPQPITTAPMVVRNPLADPGNTDPGLLVLFGTGQYLVLDDTISTDIQSFYGIIDDGTSNLNRGDLAERSLAESSITVDNVDYNVRESDGEVFDGENGWYVDFDTEVRERIIQSPQVRGDYVFVNSTIPSDDPCSVGGSGWLMAFGLDGRTPDRVIWPKLGDEYVGYKTEGGLPNRSGFLGDFMFTTRSDNEILTDEVDVGGDQSALGRMSWQELYD